jgi:hypothetical protein
VSIFILQTRHAGALRGPKPLTQGSDLVVVKVMDGFWKRGFMPGWQLRSRGKKLHRRLGIGKTNYIVANLA